MIRRALPLAAGVLIPLFATPGPTIAQSIFESEPSTAHIAGFDVPMAVDTFDVYRVRVAPRTGLGLTINYASPIEDAPSVTLYLFDSGETLEEQFENARGQIFDWMVAQGDSVEVVLEEEGPIEVMGTDGRTYAGMQAQGTYELDGVRRWTWLFVFEKDGQLVKHRITTALDQRDAFQPRLDAFVAGTLGGVGVTDGVMGPGLPLWQADLGPMRFEGAHLPMVADSFALVEVQRSPRREVGWRATWRSGSPGGPIVNGVLMPQADTSLARAFALSYGTARRGFEQQSMEFEEDEWMICEWNVPGFDAVRAISGGLRVVLGERGIGYQQTVAADAAPWFVLLTAQHPPTTDEVVRSYHPVLSEILARVRSDGVQGRPADASPATRAMESGGAGNAR